MTAAFFLDRLKPSAYSHNLFTLIYKYDGDKMSFEKDTIMLILGTGVAFLIAMQWFCWIFQFGRFKTRNNTPAVPEDKNQNIRYVIANFFVNIINDFRHLLALVIVLVFAITLFVVLYKNSASELGAAMQSVSSTFGGLIGAIIGFYFGEKTAVREDKRSDNSETADQAEAQQEEPINQSKGSTSHPPIIPIPEPAGDGGKE